MKNRKIIVSAVLLTLLSTGCVKPTEEVNSTAQGNNSNGETVSYTEQPNSVTYEESSDPIVYSDPTATTTSNSNVIYGDTVTDTVEGAELQDPPLTDMLPQAFSLSAMWFRADWCNSGQFES